MTAPTIFRYAYLFYLSALLTACAGSPPTQEMSDARQAVKQAQDSGAGSVAPKLLQSAEKQLKMAEGSIADKSYKRARMAAETAKNEATLARKAAMAFKNAEMAMKNAAAVKNNWRDTRKILDKAKKAAAKGEGAKAVKLANQAQVQAENAVNQYYLENAAFIVQSLRDRGRLSHSQQAGISAVQKALSKKNGRKAYEMASKL